MTKHCKVLEKSLTNQCRRFLKLVVVNTSRLNPKLVISGMGTCRPTWGRSLSEGANGRLPARTHVAVSSVIWRWSKRDQFKDASLAIMLP